MIFREIEKEGCSIHFMNIILDFMKKEGKATRREIISHLRANGFEYSDPAADKYIRTLCQLGRIEQVGRGVYKLVQE